MLDSLLQESKMKAMIVLLLLFPFSLARTSCPELPVLMSAFAVLIIPLFVMTIEADESSPLLPSSKDLVKWTPPTATQLQSSDMAGEMGAAVDIPADKVAEADDRFSTNQFNIVASDLMSVNRSLPDFRPEDCLRVEHPPLLPPTSVIIIFHNEAWSTLIRSVHSVINRSPPQLVKEIILVDDASDSSQSHLGTRLEEYMSRLPVLVRILRSASRAGLIRARLLGASQATAPVLTFLDSHVECSQGWLQPLLAQVAADRHAVVSPVIDIISDQTFEYIALTEVSVGGFDWSLNFNWFVRPDEGRDKSIPLPTPTMAGGLFSVDREYFYSVGAYDEGMDVWGAENLEMAFRVWMCGGHLLIHPCSHVGHVFRKTSPYTFPGGTEKVLNKNKMRLAEVWMDEWKEFFTATVPSSRTIDTGDLSERRLLRSELRCNSFRWYLETVYPESSLPLHSLHLGQVMHEDTGHCLDTLARKVQEKAGTAACHGEGGNQVWSYTAQHQLRAGDVCLDAAGRDGAVNLWPCHGLQGNQAWIVSEQSEQGQTIVHWATERCLVVVGGRLGLGECEVGSGQRWHFVEIE
eukprot:GFUD01043295.1.p1 GENE.GFUD01043295.1~~GFUD01043295.1.p1  ORF type:complete len:577 (-),score=160.56 GFUD01043295.1:148-1878(-)